MSGENGRGEALRSLSAVEVNEEIAALSNRDRNHLLERCRGVLKHPAHYQQELWRGKRLVEVCGLMAKKYRALAKTAGENISVKSR